MSPIWVLILGTSTQMSFAAVISYFIESLSAPFYAKVHSIFIEGIIWLLHFYFVLLPRSSESLTCYLPFFILTTTPCGRLDRQTDWRILGQSLSFMAKWGYEPAFLYLIQCSIHCTILPLKTELLCCHFLKAFKLTLHFQPFVGTESITGCKQKVWYPLSHVSHTSILLSSPECL